MSTHRFGRRCVVFGLLFAAILSCSAQGRGIAPIVEGTRYVISFMKVMPDPTERPLAVPQLLLISSRDSCKVRIQSGATSALKIDKVVDVLPGVITHVAIPTTSFMAGEHGVVDGSVITVSSSSLISVSSMMLWMGNGELVRHLPVASWGTEYRTFNLYQDRYGFGGLYKYRPAQAVIVSAHDSTVIDVSTPFALQSGGPSIDSLSMGKYRIRLNKNERMLLLWRINDALNKEWLSDPSGTLITSNHPIAVLSGHTKGAIMRYPDVLPPTGMFAAEASFVRNCIQDAMYPVSTAGTEFVTVPVLYSYRTPNGGSAEFGIDDDRGDVIRFIATEDNTLLSRPRQDGTGMINVAKLDKGEVYTISVVEQATCWKTTKPTLCMQYGKSWANVLPNRIDNERDDVQARPTLDVGMPMMQSIPPVDRWITHGSFYSTEGTDNFMSVACLTADIPLIAFNGRRLNGDPNNPFREIPGTQYSFIRLPVSAGDNTIRSTNGQAKFMAWSYGSLDGLQPGRSYGAPVGIDLTQPCGDTLALTDDPQRSDPTCGVYTVDVSVRSGVQNCSQIHSISLVRSNNMMFDAYPVVGLDTSSFTLRCIDPTISGSATVRVMSTSGTYRDTTYTYSTASFTVDPSNVDFGNVRLGEQRCTTFTILNTSATDTLSMSQIDVIHLPSIFTMMPTQGKIGPGDSLEVMICVRPTTPTLEVDTVRLHTSCYRAPILECKVFGDTSAITVTDIDWKVDPEVRWHVRGFDIINHSSTPLIINDLQWKVDQGSAPHFRYETQLLPLPFAINAGARWTIEVAFNPLGKRSLDLSAQIVVSSTASSGDSVCVMTAKSETVSSVFEAGERSIAVYPQPLLLSSHGALRVDLEREVAMITITDHLGTVIERFVPKMPIQIPSAVFPASGLYVVALETTLGSVHIPVLCIE